MFCKIFTVDESTAIGVLTQLNDEFITTLMIVSGGVNTNEYEDEVAPAIGFPLANHWYAGVAPPFTSTAFNVIAEPAHKAVSGEIVTCGSNAFATEMNNDAESTIGAEQPAFEFNITFTCEPFTNAAVTNESVVPL